MANPHREMGGPRKVYNAYIDPARTYPSIKKSTNGREPVVCRIAAGRAQERAYLASADRSRRSLLICIATIAAAPISAPTISKISTTYAAAQRACRGKSQRSKLEARRLKRRRLIMAIPVED
jgi:hypothetical protein